MRTALGIYVLTEDTHLSRWVENSRRLDIDYNLNEIAQIAHLIPEGGTVIDAGACLGDHAILYSQLVGGDGMVWAFEPHPTTYAALAKNMARFKNVTTLPLALGATVEDAVLRCTPNIGASFLGEDRDWPGVLVSTTTLDDERVHFTRCDFLHLDAEGREGQILHGARHVIEQWHPALLLEVCDSHLQRAGSSAAELCALVTSLGYTYAAVSGYDDPRQWEMIATHPARV